MPSFNKVMLIGNLTRDPVLKTTTSGFPICEFGLAVSRKYRTQQGEERNETCFIDINFMGKQADLCNRYLHKGDPLYIEGHLKYDSWTDKVTQKQRSRLLVVGDNMQFLRSAPDSQNRPPVSAMPGQPAPRPMTPPPAFGQPAPPPMNPPPAFSQQSPCGYSAPVPPPPPPMTNAGAAADGGDDFYEDLPF